jgi:ABC-2 type transport system permease protein
VTRLVEGLLRQNIRLKDIDTTQSSLEDIFVDLVRKGRMNHRAIWAIYRFEMARTGRTIFQSIVSPVLSTSLYFIVFGAAIGSRIPESTTSTTARSSCPGLIMMTLLTQSVMNASFGIYFPASSAPSSKFSRRRSRRSRSCWAMSAPAATKSIILGLIILATAYLFVPLRIEHPILMLAFLVLTAATFSLFGFIIGLWAEGFEKLQIIPLLVLTPLTFLGGSFYSINVLPPFWQAVSLANPIVYLISGFRWSFYEVSDVSVTVSVAMIAFFLAACLAIVWWFFKTGYKIKK